jgi:hypothetical protein
MASLGPPLAGAPSGRSVASSLLTETVGDIDVQFAMGIPHRPGAEARRRWVGTTFTAVVLGPGFLVAARLGTVPAGSAAGGFIGKSDSTGEPVRRFRGIDVDGYRAVTTRSMTPDR